MAKLSNTSLQETMKIAVLGKGIYETSASSMCCSKRTAINDFHAGKSFDRNAYQKDTKARELLLAYTLHEENLQKYNDVAYSAKIRHPNPCELDRRIAEAIG